MGSDSFEALIDVLRDREISYSREALKALYSDPSSQTAIQAWIQEYLNPETLLTKEESLLYTRLLKNGDAERIAAGDLSVVEELHDQDIRQAIEELRRSTTAIEKQNEALRLQQAALSSLVESESRATQARAKVATEQVRKWETEKEQISKEIEELSQSLNSQAVDLEQQMKTQESTTNQFADNIFRSDDKLLLSLEKLAADLDPADPGDEKHLGRIKLLCARLIKYTVEGIRTRLDRIYSESSGQRQNGTSSHASHNQEVSDLQEELESLYSEIFPVAQMSVEQQYLEPALRAVALSSGQGQVRTVKAVDYIHDCLTFLVARTEKLLKQAEDDKSHNMALQVVLEAVKQELIPSPPSLTMPSSPIMPNTPRRRKSSTSQPQIKPRHSRRRSSGEDLEPEQQLVRNLGITLPHESESEHVKLEAFERALADRKNKLNIHSQSLQDTSESSISSHLKDAHITFQLLQRSLLSETPYHKVELVDPELAASVATFEEDVQYVQKSMEEIDLQVLQVKNVRRDQFIERWSR